MKPSLDNHAQSAACYNQLPVYVLLQRLLPILRPYRFGVGGSLLLAELGLLQTARDLDLVCVAEDFAGLVQALRDSRCPVLEQVSVPPHPLYQSEFFARFIDPAGTEIDVMANIRVQQADKMQEWRFDDAQLQLRHTIPWMSAAQWIDLYQLFERPERVKLLRQFLFRMHSQHNSLD
ncbi:MAG: hypothetical protein ACK4NN_05060 [Rheinheimera sp.]